MDPIRLAAFPFDSQITGYGSDGLPEYDRASNSAEFAGLLKGFFRDGVFSGTALQVLADGGMTATVSPGGVLVQGRVKHMTSAQMIEFETAASLPRLDRVVVRLDLSNAVRDLVLDVLTGTPATTPSAPALTRNETIWEICLATIRIAAGATSIAQSNITDTRLDNNLCGVVAAVLNDFDTETFYAQVQSDLDSFKANEQAEFIAWFDNLQSMLDENVATNLQNQIDNRVSFLPQSLTNDQKSQAKLNLGVEDIEMDLLWTNASPTSEMGSSTIELDLSAYAGVTIELYSASSSVTSHSLTSPLIRKSCGWFAIAFASGSSYRRIFYVTESSVNVAAGTTGTTTADKTQNIPYKIYGVKGVTIN